MLIKLDENLLKELNCYKIEINSKPGLMTKAVNNNSTMLIVVDMINGFINDGALASPRCKAIVPNLVRVAENLSEAKKVFLRDCHSDASMEFKWFPAHCHNKKESAVVSELAEYAAIELDKNSTNGFWSLIKKFPDLSGFKNFLIVGVCTDICVLQLALSLRSYLNENNLAGNVITFTDYLETYDSPLHNADINNLFSVKLMEQAGIQIFKNII